MIITDYFELLVLHRAVFEAKFQNPAASPEVVGSPLLANVMNNLVQAIIEIETRDGKLASPSNWEEWRTLTPNRIEWKLIVERIKKIDKWGSWEKEKKTRVLNDLISPFAVGDYERSLLLEITQTN